MFDLEYDASWCSHELSVRSWRILMVAGWYRAVDHANVEPTGVNPVGCNARVNAGVDAGADIGRNSAAVPVSWTCAPRYF